MTNRNYNTTVGYYFDTTYPKSSSRLAGTRADTIDEVAMIIRHAHERALKKGYDHSNEVVYIVRHDYSYTDDSEGNFISRSDSERVVAEYKDGNVTLR